MVYVTFSLPVCVLNAWVSLAGMLRGTQQHEARNRHVTLCSDFCTNKWIPVTIVIELVLCTDDTYIDVQVLNKRAEIQYGRPQYC
jgi:hypothetical protein